MVPMRLLSALLVAASPANGAAPGGPSTFLVPPRPASAVAVKIRADAALRMGAALRPSGGGGGVALSGAETAKLDGGRLSAEERSGRYYLTDAGGSGDAFIGDNALAPGVRYVLGDGMRIRTSAGEEYEVKIDGDGPGRDAVMGMMFDAMRASFGISDVEDESSD